MHLYILFLNGKRREVEVRKDMKFEQLISILIQTESELQFKQFSLLFEKWGRIISKDEYSKSMEQLGINREDYFTIVLDQQIQQQHTIQQSQIGSHQNDKKLTQSQKYENTAPHSLQQVIIQKEKASDKQNLSLMQQIDQSKLTGESQIIEIQLEQLKKVKQDLQEKFMQIHREMGQVDKQIQYLEESQSLLEFIKFNQLKLQETQQVLLASVQNQTYPPLNELKTQIISDLKQKLEQFSFQQAPVKESYSLQRTLQETYMKGSLQQSLQSCNTFSLQVQQSETSDKVPLQKQNL